MRNNEEWKKDAVKDSLSSKGLFKAEPSNDNVWSQRILRLLIIAFLIALGWFGHIMYQKYRDFAERFPFPPLFESSDPSR